MVAVFRLVCVCLLLFVGGLGWLDGDFVIGWVDLVVVCLVCWLGCLNSVVYFVIIAVWAVVLRELVVCGVIRCVMPDVCVWWVVCMLVLFLGVGLVVWFTCGVVVYLRWSLW